MTIPGFNRKQLHHVWQLIKLYWKGPDCRLAWTLLAIIISLTLCNIYMSYLFTKWNGRFWNALEVKNQVAFYKEGWWFIGMLFPSLLSFVIVKYTASLLSFRWRRWLSQYYLSAWFDQEKHYSMRFKDSQLDNPDQRIAQDTREFSRQVVHLCLSLFTESVNFLCFVGMLWTLSGSWLLSLGIFGTYNIPGYLVWIALIYVFLNTLLTFIIGKPIIRLDYQQEQLEADFRYQLVRVREHSEEIAFYKGGNLENSLLLSCFEDIRVNFYQLLKQYVYLNTLQEFHKNFAVFFPIIMSASNFFSGVITLGTLMQIRHSFGHIQRSASVLIHQYDQIAAWLATTKRLAGFSEVLLDNEVPQTGSSGIRPSEAEDEKCKLPISQDLPFNQLALYPTPGSHSHIISLETQNDRLELEELQLSTPQGLGLNGIYSHIISLETQNDRLELEELQLSTPQGLGLNGIHSLVIKRGGHTLIKGRSGGGKTTLLRALAGLWPYGSGVIATPIDKMFIPQRAYLPLGVLKQSLTYPEQPQAFADQEILEIMDLCDLAHLKSYLNDEADWSQRLSLGEQQRVAFVRILAHKPAWLLMDEPTSALDAETENKIFALLKSHLPGTTYITISHSEALENYHETVIQWTAA